MRPPILGAGLSLAPVMLFYNKARMIMVDDVQGNQGHCFSVPVTLKGQTLTYI